jgi:hypothetical protein
MDVVISVKVRHNVENVVKGYMSQRCVGDIGVGSLERVKGRCPFYLIQIWDQP